MITYMLYERSRHSGGGVKYEVFHAKTPDGWELALRRYMPEGKIASNPVILCHGLGANAYVMDFGKPGSRTWEKYSLARYLYEGEEDNLRFEVWVAELRGRNGSATFSPARHPRKYTWCVDDYIDKDVPAIINFVRNYGRRGRKPRVFWVGKSMGGMIAYAYGQEHGKDLAGVVTLSSPVAFQYMENNAWPRILKWLERIYPRRSAFPLAWFRWIKRLGKMEEFVRMFANESNINRKVLEEYMEKGQDNIISSRVFSQFAIFIKHKNFCRYPDKPWLYDIFRSIPALERYFAPHSYKYNMRKFTPPLLAIAGGGDRTAPPLEVKYAFDNAGSEDKRYVVFRKGEEIDGIRCTADYGHVDLTAGKKVSREVYPVIYRWLAERTRKRRN